MQELRELRSLRRGESVILEQVAADVTLNRHILQESSEKALTPRARCTLAVSTQTHYRLSQRRSARLIPSASTDVGVRLTHNRAGRIGSGSRLTAMRVRFGYRRLTVLLRREGWRVNAKGINDLNDEERLKVRTKPRKEAGESGAGAAARGDAAERAREHGLCQRPYGRTDGGFAR